MPLNPIDHGINISKSARLKSEISSGDFIWVKVIKKLAPGKFAVGIKGKVYPAATNLDIDPGSSVRAKVEVQGNNILLRLGQTEDSPIANILAKLGVEQTPLNALIVSTLISQNLSLDPKIISRIRLLLEKLKGDPVKNIKLIALLIDKGISIESSDIEGILNSLLQKDHHQKGKDKGFSYIEKKNVSEEDDTAGETAKILQADIEASFANPSNEIAVFNHLRAKNENWIVIPFNSNLKKISAKGSLRLLYDPFLKKIKKSVIAVEIKDNEFLFFDISSAMNTKIMKIIGKRDFTSKITRTLFRDFREKMDEIGVKVKDSFFESETHDGFNFRQMPSDEIGIDTDG